LVELEHANATCRHTGTAHSLELLDRIGQVPRRARTCRPAEKEHISTAEHVFRFRPSKGTP
jgi:hypothetical protein